MRPILLFEDSRQRGPAGKRFGPHELLLACVRDELGHRPSIDKLLGRCMPRKGVSNVLKDLDLLADKHYPIVVIVDRDEIRPQLNLEADTSDELVRRTISNRAPTAQLAIFMLEDNVETIFETLAECGLESVHLEKALAKKTNARDLVCEDAIKAPRFIRACLRAKMPSFDELVKYLVALARDV